MIANMENITNISMAKTSRYGHFELTGKVNGEWVKLITTNSMAFDYYNDYEEENEELHEQAMNDCIRLLLEKYDN